jgi:hypothetical protein
MTPVAWGDVAGTERSARTNKRARANVLNHGEARKAERDHLGDTLHDDCPPPVGDKASRLTSPRTPPAETATLLADHRH